jgi:arginyl-tRNA synthetase
MIAVKQQLLAALAAEVDKRLPGAGAKAVFETPKAAAHGDLASNMAMQLAKPLKANPRQLAEDLKAALMAQPAYQQWVQAIEIAGPGFINFRLKPALAARAPTARRCWWNSSPPIPPGLCMSGTAGRRPWVMRSAICLRPRAGP